MSFSVVIDRVSYGWADGTLVLDQLEAAFPAGRTGLIGTNGSGKSTLLKILAGELKPAGGSVTLAGRVGYLAQNLTLRRESTVADLLGIAPIRAALHAIESGDVAVAHFEAVGDDWDVEERARAELDRLGLDHVHLDRTVGTLSGGEVVMVGLAAQFLSRPDVLLLDEPTNNLDLDARTRLYAAVEAWPGVLVVVSHDRALLALADQIAELREGRVRMFGGDFADYERMLAAEQDTAERLVRVAEADMRKQKRELADALVKLDRRVRYGNKMYAQKREPKIVMNARKREAQVSAGKHRTMHQDKLEEARDKLTEAEQAVRDDKEIRISLPETAVPAGRVVLELPLDPAPEAGDGAAVLEKLLVQGPERIALTGANGSGKTTLLKRIAAHGVPVPLRYLPQRLDLLDESMSVLDNVRAFAPQASVTDVRSRLARFLFRGQKVHQPVVTLSGGERFRATLAALLSADPAPQLLLLDEPTNNLDLASVRQLTQALSAYRGALIVASHDLPFLEELGITRWLVQDRETGLSES
ncbi:ABC-F family ATP-binding cassette domain-containing protein [Nonomuraea typhae]|uniref:ABC-F family ATP-binding cassette domain-containing protein n=1 Tax=Nonomuraea typhae TaxID=2603600 RepID=UPI0012F7D69F|nr:ABC-F family ATP-binding cassette domain-containing protein [Nonomuraea typhae]